MSFAVKLKVQVKPKTPWNLNSNKEEEFGKGKKECPEPNSLYVVISKAHQASSLSRKSHLAELELHAMIWVCRWYADRSSARLRLRRRLESFESQSRISRNDRRPSFRVLSFTLPPIQKCGSLFKELYESSDNALMYSRSASLLRWIYIMLAD